ncbi:protein kinase family protein [Actinokineospora guangxiensis]|uniref:non-specific serine/threonine protein kinase n=1 Tax=Actinokineospora guangxiensis TaxID=1490288 RepID=A0ABW0EU45_9PSEU
MVRVDLVLADLNDKYGHWMDVAPAFRRIYEGEDPRLRTIFASFHERLNALLAFMNEKNRVNKHYNAEDSRQLLDLIDEMDEVREALKSVDLDFTLAQIYQAVLDQCQEFLVRSGGSTIPDDFPIIKVERYEPVFVTTDSAMASRASTGKRFDLQLIGEGSYAIVHKFFDDEAGLWFARKKAKAGLTDRDLARFRGEYKVLKSLNFPYIVEAYRYDRAAECYTMEYCHSTLDAFITRHNNSLGFSTRKRIALQLLYALHHLHSKGIPHRDISKRNILLKEYEHPVVTVKLSDFGLHKDPSSELTHTGSSMKGTIIDPTLDRFKDFDILAEIYAIGHVLSFIFTGRKSINGAPEKIRSIISRCTHTDTRIKRYPSIGAVITDIDELAPADWKPTKHRR